MDMLITNSILEKADSYGVAFSSAGKSVKNFGNASVLRTRSRQESDARRGRIGELMFGEYLKPKEIYLIFDEEIRQGSNVGDGGRDIVATVKNGKTSSVPLKVDIKSTSKYGGWILVETHRFTADAYVLMQVSEDQATYRGYAFREDFFDSDGAPYFEYFSGDKLRKCYDTDEFLEVTLDAPHQYGLPIPKLRKDGVESLLGYKKTEQLQLW